MAPSACGCLRHTTGGDLGGMGDGAPKFEVGGRPYIRPPNILRTSVIGCEAKYELTKNGLQEELWVVK